MRLQKVIEFTTARATEVKSLPAVQRELTAAANRGSVRFNILGHVWSRLYTWASETLHIKAREALEDLTHSAETQKRPQTWCMCLLCTRSTKTLIYTEDHLSAKRVIIIYYVEITVLSVNASVVALFCTN